MEARKTVWTPGGQIRGWERSVEARRAVWRPGGSMEAGKAV